MVLEYRNRHGLIRLCGGGNGFEWRILEITGLGPVQKHFTYHTYAGVYGRELSSVAVQGRTITISGDITKAAKRYLSMRKAIRILNEDGELTLYVGRAVRKALVRTVSFTSEERNTAFCKFTWQLESDNPYFLAAEEQEASVFCSVPLLKTQFVLPCMFSSRKTEANVINNGDVLAEPVFVMKKPLHTEKGNGGIVLKNAANGACITLQYDLSAGEEVVLDMKNRTVVSSINGSLVGYLSEDSVLRLFVLEAGENLLSVVCSDASVSVECRFYAQFLEACYHE